MILIQHKETGLIWRCKLPQGYNYVWPNLSTAIHYWETYCNESFDKQDTWEIIDMLKQNNIKPSGDKDETKERQQG